MEIRTEIEIKAPAERIWQILTDFDAYPDWNPFIRRAEGQLQKGQRLEVTLQPPGSRAMTFRPTIINVVPDRELRWLGKLWLPGLLDGEHVFELQPMDRGGTRFTQRERFIGIAVPLLRWVFEKPTLLGFEEMNDALKERAEGRAAQSP